MNAETTAGANGTISRHDTDTGGPGAAHRRMTESPAFDFGDNSVAQAYDDVLVPVLFQPWADRLDQDHPRWEGRAVVDLATGTGPVARRLADQVGPMAG